MAELLRAAGQTGGGLIQFLARFAIKGRELRWAGCAVGSACRGRLCLRESRQCARVHSTGRLAKLVHAKLVPSNAEANRKIKEKAVDVGDERQMTDLKREFTIGDQSLVLRMGRKYIRLVPTPAQG